MLELSFRHRPTVRFAYSPLWEIVAGVRSLPRAELDRMGGRLRDEAGLPCAEFEIFVDLIRGGGEYIPDFLTPPPTEAPEPDRFGDELERVAAVPEETVHAELEAAAARRSERHPRLRAPIDDPAEVLRLVGRCYEACWTHVVEPAWPRYREVLEADVLFHARRLAFDGRVGAVADGIGPRVVGNDRTILIRCETIDDAYESEAEDVVFVPSVSCWPETFIDPGSEAASAVVYYPARGAGRVRGVVEPIPDDRLARLLGGTRARVLRDLGEPVTTTRLARRLEVSPSAISQHLSLLGDAGLTRRTRIGRRVYYERSRRGEELVALFSE